MKKICNIYLGYCIYVIVTYIISVFYNPDVGLLLIELSFCISGVLILRLFYKTTIKNTYTPVYNAEKNNIVKEYDDYVYNNYINAKICKKRNRKFILLLIFLSYMLGFSFFAIYIKPILWLFYIVYVLFGILVSYLYIKGERAMTMYHKTKDNIYFRTANKYIVWVTICFLFGFALISTSFKTVTSHVTEYFTENEAIIMISNVEEKYGDGEKYNYLFHTEKCDIIGRNCEITLKGYFNSDANGLLATYFRDEDGMLYLKSIYDARPKEDYIEMSKDSSYKKFKLD